MQASGQGRLDSSLYEGAMLGFIVGDAYGVFYEFEDAADIEASMEMRGLIFPPYSGGNHAICCA